MRIPLRIFVEIFLEDSDLQIFILRGKLFYRIKKEKV